MRNLKLEERKEALSITETGTNITYSKKIVEITEKTKLTSRTDLFGVTFQQKVSDSLTERVKLEEAFKETLIRQNNSEFKLLKNFLTYLTYDHIRPFPILFHFYFFHIS